MLFSPLFPVDVTWRLVSSCFHCIFHVKSVFQLLLTILIPNIYYLSLATCYSSTSVFTHLILETTHWDWYSWFFFMLLGLFWGKDSRMLRPRLSNLCKMVQLGGSRLGFKHGQADSSGHVLNHFSIFGLLMSQTYF